MPAEDSLASVNNFHSTNSTEIPWENIDWNTSIKELMRLYYESAKFQTRSEKGYRTEFTAKYSHIQKVAERVLITKLKDIRNNLLISEDRPMEINRQVDSAGKNVDNEYQLQEAASQDQAATGEAKQHNHAIAVPREPHDDLIPPQLSEERRSSSLLA